MSDLAVVESLETPVALPTVGPARHYGLLQAVLLLIAGIVILYVGLVPMGHVPGSSRSRSCCSSCRVPVPGLRPGRQGHLGPGLRHRLLALLVLAGRPHPGHHLRRPPAARRSTRTPPRSIGSPATSAPTCSRPTRSGPTTSSLDILSRSIYAARVSLSTAAVRGRREHARRGHDRHARRLLPGLARHASIGVGTDSFLAIPALSCSSPSPPCSAFRRRFPRPS